MPSRRLSSTSLPDTLLRKSGAYEPELKDLEVSFSSLPIPHTAGGIAGLSIIDHRADGLSISVQEKLLEGLSNCRALESVIRDSFTSIKVRYSSFSLPINAVINKI